MTFYYAAAVVGDSFVVSGAVVVVVVDVFVFVLVVVVVVVDEDDDDDVFDFLVAEPLGL